MTPIGPRWLLGAALLTTMGWGGSTARAQIVVTDIGVGFPTRGESGAIYRSGAFAPLFVKLKQLGADIRELTIQVEQRDRDGDFVVARNTITLTPGMDGPERVHWVYFVPKPTLRGDGLSLQVLDGAVAVEVVHDELTRRRLDISPPEFVDDNCLVVLEISSGTASRILDLDERTAPEYRFSKPVRVSHIHPDMVPDHWHGLEMVDIVIWDEAEALSPAQERALLEWVRYGGTLLVCADRGYERLTRSEVGAALPLEPTGLKSLDAVPLSFVKSDWYPRAGTAEYLDLAGAVEVVGGTPRPDAVNLQHSAGGTVTFAGEWSWGRGRLVFMGLSLDRYFGLDTEPAPRAEDLLRYCGGWRVATQQQDKNVYHSIDDLLLSQHLHEPISFQQTTAVYLVVAFSFVIAYGLIATWGSWFVLKSRGLLRLSWPVFAIVAVAGSVLSLGAVQLVRGVGRQLAQFTIVDGRAGTATAQAQCYFGYKTATMGTVDLWLPRGGAAGTPAESGPCYLRPLSPESGILDVSGFADTQSYISSTRLAQLLGVPVRATLKQLEGYWLGALNGRLVADVKRGEGGGGTNIARGGRLRNELGEDLSSCLLIEARLDPSHPQSRNSVMYVHAVGDLPAGAEIELDPIVHDSGRLGPPLTLAKLHEGCIYNLDHPTMSAKASFAEDPLALMKPEQLALLVLTTFRDFEEAAGDNSWTHKAVLQSNGRSLDRSGAIDRDHLLLVGFSSGHGPVRLYDGVGENASAVLPTRSQTAYRIVIPLAPPDGD